jgi:hypothetical protein
MRQAVALSHLVQIVLDMKFKVATMLVNVQFTDSKETKIKAVFGCPQSSGTYENLGTVETSDPRWGDYFSGEPLQSQLWLPEPVSS